jgi:hypothetical protein
MTPLIDIMSLIGTSRLEATAAAGRLSGGVSPLVTPAAQDLDDLTRPPVVEERHDCVRDVLRRDQRADFPLLIRGERGPFAVAAIESDPSRNHTHHADIWAGPETGSEPPNPSLGSAVLR